ncbi:TetR/AcrR family transcriptional regulator [Flavobacterium chungangense]|uniref:TetR family transcriptional regulator n=1 Tax=Flavobacterium chungangense TaxID=554283 RepID=A0A6V6YZ66_9FLAO|nr:TetR/AcrR family transcriptional regulator [Flavobacterium chungangense]CAD0004715.1 TetR family transcriptional regulator [Flavobacterium chungangense]
MGKAEQTRQFIIEKSAPIFNKLGYAGTSLTDLIQATGLTKGSIYGNFENKDEVALEAFRYNVRKMSHRFKSEMDEKNSYRQKLLVYADIYDCFYSDGFIEGGCPILNTSIEADDTNPVLKLHVKKAFLNWKNTIAGLIEEGQKRGEFKAVHNAEETAFIILAIIEGAVMIAKLMDDDRHTKSVTGHLRILINSL